VEGVDEYITIERQELERIQSQGIMGRVPRVEANLADLEQLKAYMLEKELTDKILEGPETEPFYHLPNWKQ
jgi:hypothetical protein